MKESDFQKGVFTWNSRQQSGRDSFSHFPGHQSMKVAVLGGGISGLAASHYLLKYGGPSIEKIILIEASERVGGWIHTKRFEDGVIHEVGPKSVRSAGVNGLNSLLLVSYPELFRI